MESAAQKSKSDIFSDEDMEVNPSNKDDDRFKKQNSYTYWVQNNKELFPQHADKNVIAPKKIDDPELLKQMQASQQVSTGSAWNKAGTWEDKKLKTDAVKQYFKTYFVDTEWVCKKDQLKAVDIETLTGEVSVIMSRGKKRIGYELEIKIKFQGQASNSGNECAIQLTELCDDGSDPESQLFVTKEKGKNAGTKLKSEIYSQNVINEVIEKCREVLNIIRDEA